MRQVTQQHKLYGNWLILSPRDEPMFRCQESKLKWYMSRDLIEVVTDKVARFKFEPKVVSPRSHQIEERQNQCVVCASKEALTRHHVVPRCYRSHMAAEEVQHNAHDVVMVCTPCHDRYETSAEILKKRLSDEYGIPLSGTVVGDKQLQKAIRNARLINSQHPAPQSRIDQARDQIAAYVGRLPTQEDITELGTRDMKQTIKFTASHGELLMQQVKDHKEFCTMWRRHFIHTMQPKHMPEYWSDLGASAEKM